MYNTNASYTKNSTQDKSNENIEPVFQFDGIKPEDIIEDAEQFSEDADKENNSTNKSEISANLKTALESRETLRQLKSGKIKFSEAILKQNDKAIFFPHTINVIQGQNGVHKSRLAENICSAFLKRHDCHNELLGFRRTNFDTFYTVVYVDTERNLSEQLPYALQTIQTQAGYDISDHPHGFEYISLLQINRKERFIVLNDYIAYLRNTIKSPLFIVLDVSTDCIEDFNKTDKSMELIDLMNMLINKHNVIFLCLIHENPSSEKARGHFGTELMNKASTAMQVSFEKDANQNNTDLIRVKYLKCRSTARHTPFYVKYSDEAKGLILAGESDVSNVINNRKTKAGHEDIIEFLEMYLGDGAALSRTDLLDRLCKDFKASQRTIEDRIKEIMDGDFEISDNQGRKSSLCKETLEKTVYYKLKIHENV